MTNPKKVIARASNVTASPRKLRPIATAVAGLSPKQAIIQLELMSKKAAYPLLNVFRQAMGNAKTNFGISPDDLKIEKLEIGEGPRGSRKADVHAHGARFDRGIRKKKLAHITLVLSGGGK